MDNEKYIATLNKISVATHAIGLFIDGILLFGLLYIFGTKTTPISIVHILYFVAGYSILFSYLSALTKIYHLRKALAACILAGLILGITLI